jgi:hypothetical protein
VSDITAPPDIRRRPIRFWIGPLTGLNFGPLIAHLLFWSPSNEWSGPYCEFRPESAGFIGPTIFGLFFGLPVGLVVSLSVWAVQRRSGYGSVPSPDRAETWAERTRTAPHAGGDDERIARRTDVLSQPDQRDDSRTAEGEPGDGIVRGSG